MDWRRLLQIYLIVHSASCTWCTNSGVLLITEGLPWKMSACVIQMYSIRDCTITPSQLILFQSLHARWDHYIHILWIPYGIYGAINSSASGSFSTLLCSRSYTLCPTDLLIFTGELQNCPAQPVMYYVLICEMHIPVHQFSFSHQPAVKAPALHPNSTYISPFCVCLGINYNLLLFIFALNHLMPCMHARVHTHTQRTTLHILYQAERWGMSGRLQWWDTLLNAWV